MATIVKARIDDGLKTQATKVFKKMGITPSDAIRMFYTNVVDTEALPFKVKVPNATTLAAIEACRNGEVEEFDSLDDLLK